MTPVIDITVDELLTTTRNVRKRLDFDRPVPRTLIEECIELALQAPNGSNNQSWEWIVVDDRDTIQAMSDLNRSALEHFQGMLNERPELLGAYDEGRNERMQQIGDSVLYLMENMHRVPVLVVPAFRGKVSRSNVFFQASLWGSILPAAWSFMLACRSRGLGSSLTTLHLWKEEEMAGLLGIPFDRYTQAGLFPVAYTKGTDFRPAQRRPAASVIHWNRF